MRAQSVEARRIARHNRDGDTFFVNNAGKYHNENGPAIIFKDKTEFWLIDGKFHRAGGQPAVIWPDGTKEWYNHDKHHNENGPAIIYANGSKQWWLDGNSYTEAEWKNEMFKRCFL